MVPIFYRPAKLCREEYRFARAPCTSYCASTPVRHRGGRRIRYRGLRERSDGCIRYLAWTVASQATPIIILTLVSLCLHLFVNLRFSRDTVMNRDVIYGPQNIEILPLLELHTRFREEVLGIENAPGYVDMHRIA